MPRQLTQGERDELIAYMQGMTANEDFVNQRVKNVQDEGSSPMYGYLDAGDKIFTNPAAIYRTIPSIEENFESLPLDLQQQIIQGGRARDQASFMGASGGSLVTPNQRAGGLLFGDMPYMDTTARQQLSPEEEIAAMEAVRGTERFIPENITQTIPVAGGAVDERLFGKAPTVTTMPAPNMPEESNKGVFAGLLNAVGGVADRVAQKRGFTQNATNQTAINPLQTVPQANGNLQNSGAVDSGFLAAQTYPTDNRLRPNLPPKVGAFDPQNPDIMSVESFDPVEAERLRDLRAAEAAQQQSRLVEGSFDGDLGFNKKYPIVSSNPQTNSNNANQQISQLKSLNLPPEVISDLEGKKNAAESTPSDPYKWQNFFAAAAIAFDNLRMPSMRNPALVKTMQDRINFNRALTRNNRTAASIEASGHKDAKALADAVRQGTITAKDAFTIISKNPTQIQTAMQLIQDGNFGMLEQLSKAGVFQSQGVLQEDKAARDFAYNTLKEMQKERITDAKSIRGKRVALGQLMTLSRNIDATKIGTAQFNNQLLQLGRTLESVGLPSGLTDEIKTLDQFNAVVNQLVLEELRSNKGPQTDFDAIFAGTTLPNAGNSLEANMRILNYLDAQNEWSLTVNKYLNEVFAGATSDPQMAAAMAPKVELWFAENVPGGIDMGNGTVVFFGEFKRKAKQKDRSKTDLDIVHEWIKLDAEMNGEMNYDDIPHPSKTLGIKG